MRTTVPNRRHPRRTFPPEAEYFTAFRARFPIALLNRTGSLATIARMGTTRSCTPRSAANLLVSWPTIENKWPSRTGTMAIMVDVQRGDELVQLLRHLHDRMLSARNALAFRIICGALRKPSIGVENNLEVL